MTTTKHPCLALGRIVLLRSQPLPGISGIGDDTAGAQADFACLLEDRCPHLATPRCRVRQLNTGEGESE